MGSEIENGNVVGNDYKAFDLISVSYEDSLTK
jgi:hypothetical protein